MNNTNNPDWTGQVYEILDSPGADVVVDNTGNTNVISQCYNLTLSQGRTILEGVPKKGDNVSLFTLPIHFGKKIIGSHGGNGFPSQDISRFMKVEKQGGFDLNPIIWRKFPLEEINSAIYNVTNGSAVGRVLLEI